MNKKNFSDAYYLWDSIIDPPCESKVILWKTHNTNTKDLNISIPELIEKNSDSLKAKYLEWVYQLGKSTVKGKTLIDHLQIRKGFSYWWSTALAQKFNLSGTRNIDQTIKLLAFEELVIKENINFLFIKTDDTDLKYILNDFCLKKKINFRFLPSEVNKFGLFKAKLNSNKIWIIRDVAKDLITSGLAFFLLIIRWSLGIFNKKTTCFENNEIFLMDILVHFNLDKLAIGSFESEYWGQLPQYLIKANICRTWVHLFYKNSSVPNINSANKIIQKLNNNKNEKHYLLENNLTIKGIFQAGLDFFKIFKFLFFSKKINLLFTPQNSALNLWKLYEKEWINSFCGPRVLEACIQLAMIEFLFTRLPKQKLGLYVQENQNWELALIYVWKKEGHGKLIGVPHTVIRYWDLRYFFDSRTYGYKGKNVLPLPDLVAINGKYAKKMYLDAKYPADKLIEVEALRFMGLSNLTIKSKDQRLKYQPLKILICGDYLKHINNQIFEAITFASKFLPSDTVYLYKPHPAYLYLPNKNIGFALQVIKSPLNQLLATSNLLISGNSSSTAVAAYISGINLIQYYSPSSLNGSPLRGVKGIYYFNDGPTLLNHINSCKLVVNTEPMEYFYLNKDLPCWKKLISDVFYSAAKI